jgi:hypothetical protein
LKRETVKGGQMKKEWVMKKAEEGGRVQRQLNARYFGTQLFNYSGD